MKGRMANSEWRIANEETALSGGVFHERPSFAIRYSLFDICSKERA